MRRNYYLQVPIKSKIGHLLILREASESAVALLIAREYEE